MSSKTNTKSPVTSIVVSLDRLIDIASSTGTGEDIPSRGTFRSITVRDDQDGQPVDKTKTGRLDVRQHLKGGSKTADTDRRGYITLYEPVNRNRALKKFRQEAERIIAEQSPKLETAQVEAAEAMKQLTTAEDAADKAQRALAQAERQKYDTKKAREDTLRPHKQTDKQAARELKSAQEQKDRATKVVTKIQDKIRDAQTRLADPVIYLHGRITKKIEDRQEELSKTTDPDKRAELQRRIESEQELLADPVKSLLDGYHHVDTRKIVSVRVGGKEFVAKE